MDPEMDCFFSIEGFLIYGNFFEKGFLKKHYLMGSLCCLFLFRHSCVDLTSETTKSTGSKNR